MKKSIRYKVGDVIALPLRDGSFGYGRVLKQPEIAFYDLHSLQKLSLDEVVTHSILFKLFVQDEAIKDGSWEIIGSAPLSNELLRPHPYFVWGPLQERPFITYDGSEKILATPEECKGLERVIIWDAKTVGHRLYDTLIGGGDKWVLNVEQEW